ncbi:39S ribosomal protein L9, mitochondrial [Lamellibrachia satsuma]|nr:39S ribosomal protein L9, mitochondrial [Lamellibrachia satsuma]
MCFRKKKAEPGRLNVMMLKTAVVRTAVTQAVTLLSRQILPCHAQQLRTAIIVRRMFPPRLYKKGVPKTLKRREYIYSIEENTDLKPAGNMTVILVKDVEGVGLRGQVLTVTKKLARNVLIPTSAAIYASPENLMKNEEERKNIEDIPRQSIVAQKTIRQLQAMTLRIPMNPNVSWTLNKTHVRVAFRKMGVQVPQDCITIPDEAITEFGDATVKVTVNKLDTIPVKAIIYPYNTNAVEQQPLPKPWKKTRVPLGTILDT